MGFYLCNYLTASLRALPALKAGTFEAAISISAPVCGLRPLRAARSRTSKLPKPINCTFSPSARKASIAENTASTAAAESFFVSSVASATFAIKSCLLAI
ncbi:DNA-binding protein HU [Streptococcus dysgalactiae subsp. equisimilis RE378]|nr:DNA-binding protein HU [Streptococcus dysgalactiae subsp. equisimilis RE378]